jgi:hypothetical protein
MPKYTIEFHHDEEEEFQICIKSMDYWNALFDLDQWLRNKLKYEDINEEQYKAFEEVRNELHQKLNEYNINL